MASAKGHFSVTFKDGKKALASTPYFFNSSSGLLVDIVAGANAFVPLIDAVTESQIVKAKIVIDYALPGGLKGSAVSGADNEDSSLLDTVVAGSSNAYGVITPAWIAAGFLSAQPKYVDLAQADVSAYVSWLIGGATGIVPSDRYYNDITAIPSGVNAFRKHRSALRRAK